MKRSAYWVYGLLVAASVVYGSCLFTDLFGGQQHWGRGDWDQFTFRFATPRTAMLRDGQLPFWNPYDNGGNELNHVIVREENGSYHDLTPGDNLKAGFLGWHDNGEYFYLLSTERDQKSFDVYKYSATDYSREHLCG